MRTDRTILLVADDPAALDPHAGRLAGTVDAEIVAARGIVQAMTALADAPPDVVVLDLGADPESGRLLAERLQRACEPVTIPVVYLSAERSDRVSRLAREHAAFAVVYKPLRELALVSTVRAALDSRVRTLAAA
ncbi:MAG: response regulator [Planctomycetota bacterium]|jgi:DNA-binding response OmpR family regulator